MTIQSANAAMFRVTRIAGLSIIQLYFASIMLLLSSGLMARASQGRSLELRGLRRKVYWFKDQRLQLYTAQEAKGSVNRL
jgi:hypothetical protein